ENGKHTVIVTDEAGNESTVTFVIDTEAPTVSLDDNSFYKNTVEFTVTDATEVTVTVKHTSLTGNVVESTLTKDANGNYSISEDGVYEITAKDQAGNTTTRTVTIDTGAPIISVDDNSFHKTDVEFTVTDQTSVTVKVTLDGNEITLNPTDGKYTATEEGIYQVTATDAAGMSATKTFTIDKTAPVAKVDGNEIVNGTVYGTPITFVTADKTNVTVSSKEGTPSVTKNADGSYTATENGTYELTLIDQAGNEATVTFIIDKDAPETDLVGEKYYPGKVEFTVTDQSSVTVKVNHTAVGSETATESTLTKDENGKYSVTIDGYYEITITDEAGHTTTREFAIDSVAPVFNVTNNSYHKTDVELTITDATIVDIRFDSTSINDGEANIELDEEGYYRVSGDGIYTFTATDQAGNEATVTFTIDTKAPVIKNIEDGKSYKSGVTIEVEDATLATLQLGDTVITNGSTVTGEGTYTVTATDQAGNVTTVTFTVDDTEPTITFPEGIEVEDNAFTTRKEVAKTGSYTGIDTTTITADEKITVTKIITNNAGEEITEIPLTALATYTVTYTIADEAGNTVTVTETVIVEDTEAPVITIDGNISLIIVEKGASVTYPTITAEDIYEGSVAVTDDRANVDINTPTDYTVTFTAKDSSNNIATKTITVRVLNLDKLRKEENKLKTLAGFVDPNGDKFGSYNENKDDYTEESWNAKQALIDELNNIISGNSDVELEAITQDFVNEKMNAIEALKLQPKELDLTEYNAQIDRFNKLVETDYTEESWREALAYKNQSIANIKLQSDLNYFTRSQLKRAIDDLERIDLYDYANATVKEFMADYKTGDYEETVHEAAINKLIFELSLPIMSNHTIMLKSEFDKQVEELRKQVEAARLPIDPTALEELKNDLKENYNEADYTKESWKAIQDLIKDVEKVVADDGLRSEFKEAMDKIDLGNLVLIPKVDETTIGFTSSSNTNYAKLGDTLTLTFSGNKALSNATVTINGKEATVTKTETGFTATVTVEENDKEGKVTYTINPEGEEVTPVTKESNIIVDITLPTLNISAPAPDGTNNWYKTTPTINIDALEDINGIDYENSYYTVTVNGEEGARNSLLNGETPITTIPVASEISGEVVVKVVAMDNAGNVTTVSKNLNVDKVLPTITISNIDGSKSETFNGIGEIPTYYFNESVNITAIDNITSVEGYPTITLNGNSYVPGTEFVSNQVNIIEVTDVAGNTTQVKVVVDTEAPTITLTNKENVEATGKDYEEQDGTVTYYKETLNLTIRDNIDKDLTITATFTNVDGEVSDITLAKDENGVYTASLTEIGKYVVTVTDDAGYTTTKVFVIDTKAPVVTGVKHGAQYKDETLIVEFDDYSLESATLNKQPFTSGSSIMEEGKHSLVILDKAGNKTSVTFIVDRTAPTVTLTSEEVATEVEDTEKVYYYKKPVTITFEDRGNISQFPVLTGKISFTSDKTDKTDIEEYEDRNLLSGTTVEEEGTYTVTTKDKAGNTTIVKFIIDQTSPIITKPLAGVYGDAINIEFTEGTAKIGDVEYNNGDSFDIEGTHTLVVTDEAGNKTEVTFTIDKSKPIIEGIPAKGINNSGLEITVTDATKTTVKIDDEIFIDNEYIQDGKTFTYDVEGTHTIVAVDAAGNTETVTFTIDKSAPTISGLENPKATDTDASGNVIKKYFDKELELTFNDATAIIVTVNGEEVTLTEDNKYSFQDGEYVVVVTDEAGFTTTETFVIDTKDPIITGVEQDKHYKERPTIEVSDDTLASITIDENPFNNDYAEGEHTVTATDKLGHTTSIKFVYDITAPTITIVDGENAYTEDATITVEARNETYTIPTATATDTYSGDRKVTYTGNVDLTKLGEQTITYTATDEAGNTRTVVLTVNVVDSEAPTDLSYEILNGSEDLVNGWYIKPLRVKLSATDNGTGVTKYEYRILKDGTPVTEWVTLEDFAEPTFEMPETINGSKITFEVKAFDKADNSITKTSSEYQVDQIAPTVTATINQTPNSNGWYKEDINVLLSGNDETSGVTHFLYQVSLGNDIWTDEARLEATDGNAILPLNLESSALSYRVIAVDAAGHRSVVATNQETFKLDKTAPTITVDSSITENKTILVEASKDGIYTIPTATVKDNFDENVTVSSNGTVNLKELNDYEIIYTATDEAGNTATIVLTVTVDDTKAPVITLNGDKEITTRYGSIYQDLGATAEDNLDEFVDVKVSYNIDTYKVGSYTVTYTATDKKGNKATATRTVNVVLATTSDIFREENGCSETGECYNTKETDNYIWYSGHLWRVIKINEDNTVKLVTEEGIAGLSYGDGTSSVFKGSYAEKWLNTNFYNSLSNASNIVVESDYCNSRLTSLTDVRYTCPTKNIVKEKVALLTMDEYNILGGQQGFLNTGDRFYTMTTSSSKALWIVVGNGEKDYGYLSHEPYSMRPVITISKDVNIVSGKGTKDEPYYIQKNETATVGTNLNKRYSGEYVTLNGHTWRIMKTDGASTRLIYDTFYREGNGYARIEFGDYGTFNTTSGVGQYLNTTVYNSLFTEKEKNALLLTKWYYNSYELGKDVKTTTLVASDKYTYAYVGLASVGELMTGQSSTGRVEGLTSWTINSDSKYRDYVWHFSSVSTSDYSKSIGITRAIRPVIELSPDVTIKGGNGTAQSPYQLEY
ncbi:MAG: DUF5011 domain-containing protein, partial [Bacilli bacterium]|nr:DUF5011 domain-containing protein [Bacilli bacterium]